MTFTNEQLQLSIMKEKMLKIAKEIYGQRGHSLSLAEIARSSGVSRQTVQKHLGTKSQVLNYLQTGKWTDEPQSAEDRIFDAVAEVAGQYGFKGSTLDAIAGQAGVSVVTLLRKFENKEGLIKAFLQSRGPTWPSGSFDFEDGKSFPEQLQAICRYLVKETYYHRDIVRLVMWGSASDRKYLQSVRGTTNRLSQSLTEFFSHFIESGELADDVSPRDLAVFLIGAITTRISIDSRLSQKDIDSIGRSACSLFNGLARRTR